MRVSNGSFVFHTIVHCIYLLSIIKSILEENNCENRANQHASRFFVICLHDDIPVSTPQGLKSECDPDPDDISQESVETEPKATTEDGRT